MEDSTGTITETGNDENGASIASESTLTNAGSMHRPSKPIDPGHMPSQGLTTHRTRATRKTGNGGAKGSPVSFTVVKRKELPLNLILTGRFGKVLAAASALGPDDAIMLAKGAKQQDLNAMRTTVQDYIEKYPQMRGLKVAQSNRTLFIYRP